jgi:hypothetical protein
MEDAALSIFDIFYPVRDISGISAEGEAENRIEQCREFV